MIEALEREWRDALCNKDMDRLRSLVHPDFVLIGTRSTGPFMMNRDEWLDAIQRRDIDTIELEVQRRDRARSGDGRHGPGADGASNISAGSSRIACLLTDVWVFDEGRWRAIRRHSTPAPAGECVKT